MGFCLAHVFLDAQAPKISESQILFSWKRSQRDSKKSKEGDREVCDADIFSRSTRLEAVHAGSATWLRKSARLGLESPLPLSPAGRLWSRLHTSLGFHFTFVRIEIILGTFQHCKASPGDNAQRALRTRSGTQKVLNKRKRTVNIYILLIT